MGHRKPGRPPPDHSDFEIEMAEAAAVVLTGAGSVTGVLSVRSFLLMPENPQ